MTTNTRIDAWTILRTGAFTRMINNCEIEVLHQVTIRAILEHSDQDATQDEFDDRIDAVMLALYPQLSLTQNATIQGPASLAVEDFRIVADTVCHYCEITTVVNQTVMVTGKS
jgi:hypothetical protein